MSEINEDLSYLRNLLHKAEQRHGYPSIYLLWGCIIIVGYMVAEWAMPWTNYYWLFAAPLGMLFSSLIGYQQSRKNGQMDDVGKKYLAHFSATIGLIFIAVSTAEYSAILLLISLSYVLAGIHLDRLMLWVGALTLACFIAIEQGWLASNLVFGLVLGSGLFLAAWSSSVATVSAEDDNDSVSK